MNYARTFQGWWNDENGKRYKIEHCGRILKCMGIIHYTPSPTTHV